VVYGTDIRSQCKRCSVLSIRSLGVDEEKMRPDHWLGLVPFVPCNALTGRKDIQPIKTCSSGLQRFS